MKPTCRWIIASNRLPYQYDEASHSFVQSSGGLVSALIAIGGAVSKLWLGSVLESELPKWQEMQQQDTERIICEPIAINSEDYDHYYNGFCNDVLWPLFHYQSERVRFSHKDWQCYQKVNRLFAERIVALAEPGDLIWIHDFQLCLVPQYIRELNPELKIGWFLHIPFPSSELYLELPVRQALLQGMLSADLVGFQNYSYVQHFCRSVQRTFGIETGFLDIEYQDRQVALGVFPVSIDYALFHETNDTGKIRELSEQYSVSEIICLGVDRLDYTKGVDLKIRAFANLLQAHPELHEKVCLIQVAVPTRENVEEYQQLRLLVEQLVGEVNGQFATPAWTPIHYLYHSISFEELISLYHSSHYLLVCSKRDGMNLVALEYVAAQQDDNPGVVVMSEFAGAKSILSEAISINPRDIEGTANSLYKAIQIPQQEKHRALQVMQAYLSQYTAIDWSHSFMDRLRKISAEPSSRSAVVIRDMPHFIHHSLTGNTAQHNVAFLDYDGTLVEICDQPSKAILSESTRLLLSQLADLSNLKLVVVSGREQKFLSEQFAGLDVYLAAEHGGLFFDGGKWLPTFKSDTELWYDNVVEIMSHYAAQTPGSHVEKKHACVAWHYRRAPQEFAEYQSLKLYEELENGLSQFPVRILHGKKVIEVCAVDANKGAFVRWFLQQYPELSAGLAMGDDVTDEYMFSVLSEPAFVSIKVGAGQTAARYRLCDQTRVDVLLKSLCAFYE